MTTYKILFRDHKNQFREAYVSGLNKEDAKLKLWLTKGMVKIVSYNQFSNL